MAVCTFFLRGTCKFGDQCRNEHPVNARRQDTSGFGNSSWTNTRYGNANTGSKNLLFSADTIKSDLTPLSDKPLWPLSCYAAAKLEPNLLAGLDESPEELHFRAFTAQKAGSPAEYVTYETNKISAAEQVYSNALNNVNEAYEQAAKSSNAISSNLSQSSSNVNAGGAFGSSSAFGTPAFGQSAFGQTVLDQPSVPDTALSTFTQLPKAVSTFGQPQQPVSAFGQPQQTSAFGQPSQPSSLIKPASGAFGNLNSTGSTNAFGGGGFSAFAGQPSAFGSGAATSGSAQSPFGQPTFSSVVPAQPTSTFGIPSALTTTNFGSPSAFGALAPNVPVVSAFGTTGFNTAPNGSTSSFGTQGNSPFANSNQPVSAFSSQPTSNATVGMSSSPFTPPDPLKLQSSISSQPPSAFPMGSPSHSTSKALGPPDFSNAKSQYKAGMTPYDLNLPSDYQQLLPEQVLEAFKNKKFEWGKVPDWIPPLELR